MTRRTSPAVAVGALVGLVLGAVAYVTVSAGSPDPVPVARVASNDAVAEPVVLEASDDAAHQVRPVADDETSSDPTDDVDADGSDDVVTVPARDDDSDGSDDAEDSDRPSARPTSDDDHDEAADDDSDDSGHHDDDDDDDEDDDSDDDHDDGDDD